MQNITTFADLAPTESDAAGVVGGDAFLDLGTINLGIISLSLKID